MGGTSGEGPRRVFLGWERSPLESAAEWLARERGSDMGDLLVALPLSRACRRLLERLTPGMPPSWVPPRLCTVGELADELLPGRGRTAGRALRTLAWEAALRALPPERARDLIARPPGSDAAAAWTRLAESVRSAFGELAAEGLDFARVARDPRVVASGEGARWEALCLAQQTMTAALAAAGLVDPHLGRLAALEAGLVDAGREVVLVGAVERNAILRRALAALGARLTVLVFAPESEAEAFDEAGELRVDAWAERDLPLSPRNWSVVAEPQDQARETLRAMCAWDGRYSAEQITIGVADPEVTPYLAGRLAGIGVLARDAAGDPVERSSPARLLEAAASFLGGRTAAGYAALLRHPALEACLPAEAGGAPAAAFDGYQAKHLPGSVDGRWLAGPRERVALHATHAALSALLGELDLDEPRPLAAWAEPMRAFLRAVYGKLELREEDEGERRVAHALRVIGVALDEIAELHASLAPTTSAGEALGRLCAMLCGGAIPPAAPRAGQPTIELLGWLELAFDDAPALIVTGFQEGRVPAPPGGDAWLPNSLRAALGLPDEESRAARDAYLTTLLCCSRRDVLFVSGRRDRAGDALLPSRLCFRVPREELAERVFAALRPRRGPAPARGDAARARELPRRASWRMPSPFRVTWFKTWLESPYLFYLRHVLGLETIALETREMDAPAFGSLAHEVLELLGSETLRASTDADEIRAALEGRLRELARRRFGPHPLPAVELQLDQLAWRLARFAEHQAGRAAAGWRVEHVEWTPPSGTVDLIVDGQAVPLRGRIDRIDVHADGRWAILDYKTGEKARGPEAEHGVKVGKGGTGAKGTWKDLQLPLYAHLAQRLEREGVPELGYARLGSEAGGIGFDMAASWDEDTVADGIAAAQQVIRGVRAGAFFELGRARPYEPVLAALCGQGLLATGTEEDEVPDGEQP